MRIKKGSCGKGKGRGQIQVLGITYRCEHASQIRANSLQNNGGDQQLLLSGHSQDHNGKRHEGKQRHVIGDEHAGKEAQQGKHQY